MFRTPQIIRRAVFQRISYSGINLAECALNCRNFHSLLPPRVKITDNLLKKTSSGFGTSLGRNAGSSFIVTRNESTGTGNRALSDDIEAGIPSPPSSIPESADASSVGNSGSTAESSPIETAPTVEAIGTAEPAQEALVFESIPEPPTALVDNLSLNALGEPSLSSLGLGGWTPSGIVQQTLEFFHAGLGMPWWASIVTGTIIVRLVMFPLVVKSQRNAAKMQNNMPELQVLQAKMTEARQTGNALLSAKYGQDMMLFMKEKDISPFKSLLVPVAMAPVFISFFFGLRKMANLPVESMKEGGLFWFTDLTLADPYYLLPLITSATVFVTLELGVDGMKLNSAQHGQIMKYVMRGIPIVMFPFTLNFPAAILCYWVSTNAISLAQVSLLKIPAVRQKLNIEPLRQISPDMLPQKKKLGFRDSLKESWTNMKISKEIEDRQRYDELSFKRAGKGPIPKTFKYDPTKVSKESIAAVQAKRK